MNHKDDVINQFSKNANEYVTSETHAKGDDLPLMVKWLGLNKEQVILDIATGGGHVAKALAPHVKQVVATDLTQAMLQNTAIHLQDYENIFYVRADAEDLPFVQQQFDIVTCRIAPHHFPNPLQFVKEVARVLKKEGTFILIDNVVPEDEDLGTFMNTFEKLRDHSHNECLSVTGWEQLLSQVGFRIEKIQNRKKTFDFPVWLNRTTETEEERRAVIDFIRSSEKKYQDYFQVRYNDHQIKSLTIDEAMMLCTKT
ncbi:class I SAM-dependent methyltransferase [Salirhabdus salicampi]|uniref:class I SAM-dependent methyltransferase n=1 Tax=Salirhabdus salicampi TaxID=476102 RepID=UPI0020C236C3|nr:class I SAM-dependent methyltransferase [Salirhabdus salicampi]MCP8616383.1 class I SAM-dependent methyltransferase [Salirhabdus salicampi]